MIVSITPGRTSAESPKSLPGFGAVTTLHCAKGFVSFSNSAILSKKTTSKGIVTSAPALLIACPMALMVSLSVLSRPIDAVSLFFLPLVSFCSWLFLRLCDFSLSDFMFLLVSTLVSTAKALPVKIRIVSRAISVFICLHILF